MIRKREVIVVGRVMYAVLYAYWTVRLGFIPIIKEALAFALVLIVAGGMVAVSGLAIHKMLGYVYG